MSFLHRLATWWKEARPLHTLFYLFSFHLIFSLVAMWWLACAFNFGRRAMVLHLSVVGGLISVIILGLGSCLFFRFVREHRIPKLLLSCLPAVGFWALVILYLANYISNARWGNNFNYQVLAQWQFRAEILQQGEQILAPQIYISLLVGLIVICGVYLALAKRMFLGLEELFLPQRQLSLFRDRRRSRKSLIVICLAAAGLSLYLFLLARNVNSVGYLMDEPIISFFKTDTESAQDLTRLSVVPALREREKRRRLEYPRNQKFARKNVVLITVDSLRPDHMQVYGYGRPTTPFLSSLFASGHLRRVDFALATCPYTSCGVISTMASQHLRSMVPESFKLHDLLFDQGYQVNFVLSGNHDWYTLKGFYGTSITYYFDGENSARYLANDDRVILEGLDKVPAFSGTPAFFFFHLMSPHYTGIKQDRYRVYNPSIIEGTWESLISGKHDATTKTNNYDNGVLQADATIGEIFEALKQKGYLNDSMAVILSDHGEGLGERGPTYYSHSLTVYQEFIRIPLLIYDDPATKYENTKFARQIDVAPTILQRLGLSIPPSWQGRSLLEPSITSYSFHEARPNKVPLYAVIEWSESTIYKYLHSGSKPDELYELVSDPHERRNLISTAAPELIGRMKAKLDEYRTQY